MALEQDLFFNDEMLFVDGESNNVVEDSISNQTELIELVGIAYPAGENELDGII